MLFKSIRSKYLKKFFVKLPKQVIHYTLILCFAINSPYSISSNHSSTAHASNNSISENQAIAQFNEHIESFYRILDGQASDRFILDDFFLLQQIVFKMKKLVRNYDQMVTEEFTRFINWWDLELSFKGFEFDDNTPRLPGLHNLDFVNTSHFKDSGLGSSERNSQIPFSFTLHSKKTGEKLNSFTIPTVSLATFGPFIVFIRPNTYDSNTQTQRVTFIDLERYGHLVGNEDIPVFDFPVSSSEPLTTLKVKDGKLELGSSHRIHPAQLVDLSLIYSTAFNLTSNMVNPAMIEATLPLVDSISNYLNQVSTPSDSHYLGAHIDTRRLSTEIEDKLTAQANLQLYKKEQTRALDESLQQISSEDIPENEKAAAELFFDTITKSQEMEASITKVATLYKQGETIQHKFRALTHHLISPRPLASKKIKKSIVGVVAKTEQMMGQSPAKILNNMSSRKMMTVGMLTSAAVAVAFPESATAWTMQGLQYGGQVLSSIGSALAGAGEAVWKSTKDVSSVLFSMPSTVHENLLSDGKWKKLGIGLSALVVSLAGVLGAYHLVQNTVSVLNDRRKTSWNNLAERQRKIQEKYLNTLAEAEAELRRQDSRQFTEEEDQLVRNIIKLDIENRKNRFKKMFLQKKKNWELAEEAAQTSEAAAMAKEKNPNEINGFWKAFFHLYFSFASYSKTVLDYTGIWNAYSALRYSTARWGYKEVAGVKIPYIRFTPILLGSRLIYPNMFSTITEGRTLPTELNRGTESLHKKAGRYLNRWTMRYIMGASPEIMKKRAAAERRVNKKLLEIESRVIKASFRKSIWALSEYMKEQSEFVHLFNSDGLVNITDKDIRKLKKRNKTFLRVYFENTYKETMAEILKSELQVSSSELIHDSLFEEMRQLAPNNPELYHLLQDITEQIEAQGEVSDSSLTDLRDLLTSLQTISSQSVKLNVSDAKISEVIDQVTGLPEVFKNAEIEAEKTFKSLSAFFNNIKHEITGEFDPKQDGSMNRYAVVQEKRKKPLALARAIRAEVSNIIVTLPLEIVMILGLTAGIVEGVMVPLQPEMFAENSFFYLSRYSFYGGLVAGVLTGLLANSWYKLQQDSRHDDLGNFGNVPRGEDAKKSFLSWLLKQTNQRDNSLWSNWKHLMNIVWNNIPAYLLNAAFFNLIFLGFFDIDVWVMSLVTAFSIPMGALVMKIEQGFEKAADYDARIFPDKLLPHPEVQAYLQKRKQIRRNKFNLVFDLFRNWEGTVTTNAFLTPTETYPEGRAFSRALMGGDIVAERIITAAQEMEDMLENTPGGREASEKIRQLCVSILGHEGVVNTKHPIK